MRPIAAGVAVWLCAAVPALAQDAARLPLVGVLQIHTTATSEPFAGLLRDALAALGDVDGKPALLLDLGHRFELGIGALTFFLSGRDRQEECAKERAAKEK